jgi:hypothetical protein
MKAATMNEREDIVAGHQKRLNARKKLRADMSEARTELNPKIQLERWVYRKKADMNDLVAQASQRVRKGAPLFGLIGVGAMLLVVRRPISRWISSRQQHKLSSSADDQHQED